MANLKINELPLFTGNTTGVSLIINDNTETTTYKVTKEKLNEGLISGSSQVLSGTGIWSGSSQLPSGIVSGSSQITSFGFATTGSNTFNGNQTITGSLSISNGSITMPDRPAFRVTGAGGPTAAVTVLSGSMTTVDYNQGSNWNNTTGTFTAPIAGLYQVNLVCRTYSNASAAGQIIVFKNNTTGTTGTPQVMIEWAANTTMNHAGASTISKLVVGDTLKAVVAVGTLSFDGNDNFSVAYIG
jgi:hypothetical protein